MIEHVPSDEEGKLLRAILLLARQMRRAAAGGEVTGGALGLLATLYREGAMSGVELARREGLQPQSLSRLLARLDAAALIVRTPDARDARRHVIDLTAAGRRILVEQMTRRRDWLAGRVRDRLTAAERKLLFDAADVMLRVAG